MMISGLIFGLLGGGILAFSAYEEYMETKSLINGILKERTRQRKWKRLKANVTSIKIGLEHEDYFAYLNQAAKPLSEEARQVAGELLLKADENVMTYGDVNITYQYKINGKEYRSRLLSCLPDEKKAKQMAKRLSGAKSPVVKIYVNPDDHSESVLYIPKKEDVESVRKNILMTDKPMLVKAVLSIFLFGVVLLSI